MGEAKRKAADWISLFPDTAPSVRMAISRPLARPPSTRPLESGLAAHIADKLASGLPALCLNRACENELHVLPDVRAFLQTAAHAPIVAMGVCAQCAQQSDDTLRAIARKMFGPDLGFGLDGQIPEGAITAMIYVPFACEFVAEGVPIVVARMTPFPDGEIGTVAKAFTDLVMTRSLPRFSAFRQGAGNCHSIVRQLYLDLRAIEWTDLFEFKRGHSEILRSETDPNGQHSWIEAKGWAIDAASGAIGNPVVIMPVEDFYALMQLTDIHDIELEEQTGAAANQGTFASRTAPSSSSMGRGSQRGEEVGPLGKKSRAGSLDSASGQRGRDVGSLSNGNGRAPEAVTRPVRRE